MQFMYFDVPLERKKVDWQAFEAEVGSIFDKFGYTVKNNVRFKTVRRFQLDVLAYDETRCFFVDCKDHKYIAPKNEEEFLIKQRVRAENLVKTAPGLENKKKIPLLVTKNRSSSLFSHTAGVGKLLSVDIGSLPDLLLNIDRYESELCTL